ncbi:MAG: type II toxin-antitoxin system VapC family toxin [Candidatus Methanomethyliaceae archaeon]
MKTYVIDASVASRFLLVEDLSDKAECVLEGFLKGSFDLSAPDLVVFEVGNTLWKAIRRGLINLDEALHKFSYFLDLRINSIKLSDEEQKEVLEWSTKYDLTYYDGAYVISSKSVGGTLLTADDVLYEKARKDISIIHLKEFQG